MSAAEKDGSLFIAVTLDDGNDWNDHMAMLSYAGESFDTVEIAANGAFGVYAGGMRFSNPDDVYLTVPKGNKPVFRYEVRRSGSFRCKKHKSGMRFRLRHAFSTPLNLRLLRPHPSKPSFREVCRRFARSFHQNTRPLRCRTEARYC